jgi:hypothetical protein
MAPENTVSDWGTETYIALGGIIFIVVIAGSWLFLELSR